ncbi:TonB-dependent receptor, partial [Alistipes onderdonkii]
GYFFGSSNGSVNNPAFPGKYEQSTGNPDVTWEKKESYNIAAEVRMFRDRLSVTVDLFEEKRNNILTKLGSRRASSA